MTWGPFSAEAVQLDCQLHALHKQGRVSDALDAIKEALDKAHRPGPSNVTYEEFSEAAEAQQPTAEPPAG